MTHDSKQDTNIVHIYATEVGFMLFITSSSVTFFFSLIKRTRTLIINIILIKID